MGSNKKTNIANIEPKLQAIIAMNRLLSNRNCIFAIRTVLLGHGPIIDEFVLHAGRLPSTVTMHPVKLNPSHFI